MNSIFAMPGIATYSLVVDVAWVSALVAGFLLGRLEAAPSAKSGTLVILGTTLLLVVLKLIYLRSSPSSGLPSPVPSVMVLVTAGFGLAHAIGTLTSRHVQTPQHEVKPAVLTCKRGTIVDALAHMLRRFPAFPYPSRHDKFEEPAGSAEDTRISCERDRMTALSLDHNAAARR